MYMLLQEVFYQLQIKLSFQIYFLVMVDFLLALVLTLPHLLVPTMHIYTYFVKIVIVFGFGLYLYKVVKLDHLLIVNHSQSNLRSFDPVFSNYQSVLQFIQQFKFIILFYHILIINIHSHQFNTLSLLFVPYIFYTSLIFMSQSIIQIRKRYSKLQSLRNRNQLSSISQDLITKQLDLIIKQTNRVQEQELFQNLDQLIFYRTKYNTLNKIMKEKAQKKIKDSDQQLSKVLAQSYNQINLGQTKPRQIQSHLLKPQQNMQKQKSPIIKQKHANSTLFQPKMIVSFLAEKQKQSKIKSSGVSFSSVLDHAPIASRIFQSKIPQKPLEPENLKRLKQQNEQLTRQLIFNKNEAKIQSQRWQNQQKEALLKRKQELQIQIQYLQKDNQRLQNLQISGKSQKNPINSQYVNQWDEYALQKPYTVFPEHNNLNKLYEKNNLLGKDNKFGMESSKNTEIIKRQKIKMELQNQIKSKNKIAFFHKEYNVINNSMMSVTFKKGQLNNELNKIMVEILITNKSLQKKTVQIVYRSTENYNIQMLHKISKIESSGSERQIINLYSQCQDLNSIIDIELNFAGTIYNLLMPVIMIRFDNIVRTESFPSSIRINADSAFRSYEESKILLPIASEKSFDREVMMYGSSLGHSGSIHLKWKPNNKIQIITSQKWINLIGFIMKQID